MKISNYSGEKVFIFVVFYQLRINMFARRLVLPSECVLKKGISNVVFIYDRSAINSLISAHFSTGIFVEKYYILPLSLMNNINVKKPFLSVVEKWKPLHRFYSGDASVTFLSGGKSKYFESNALYGEDKVLNTVVEQLQDDNGIDICVIETSEERQKYADYVVVVSGRSTRHLKAMTNHIYQQVQGILLLNKTLLQFVLCPLYILK